jgi:hypothetical protein
LPARVFTFCRGEQPPTSVETSRPLLVVGVGDLGQELLLRVEVESGGGSEVADLRPIAPDVLGDVQVQRWPFEFDGGGHTARRWACFSATRSWMTFVGSSAGTTESRSTSMRRSTSFESDT